MANYVSKDGLLYFWTLLKSKFVSVDVGVTHTKNTKVGSTTKGVYVDTDGSVKEMTYSLGQNVTSSSKLTDTVTTATTSGNGNAVTSITATNGALTVTKGATFLTEHQSLANYYNKSEIDSKLTSAMRYKGSKASASALPTTNNVIGDMWNVTDTGANYVWDGSAWDETGMVIDLSPYAKTSDLVAVTNTEIDTIVAS